MAPPNAKKACPTHYYNQSPESLPYGYQAKKFSASAPLAPARLLLVEGDARANTKRSMSRTEAGVVDKGTLAEKSAELGKSLKFYQKPAKDAEDIQRIFADKLHLS